MKTIRTLFFKFISYISVLLTPFLIFLDWWELKGLVKKWRGISGFSIAYRLKMKINSSWIDPNATFSNRPCLPHGLSGIFISGGACIGKDAVIFQQVTVGSNMLLDSGHNGSPMIGDNAYLGAGCKIIGKIEVGKNVRIGANAVLVRDCDSNCTIVGVPEFRIVRSKAPSDNRFWRTKNGYIEYYSEGKYTRI